MHGSPRGRRGGRAGASGFAVRGSRRRLRTWLTCSPMPPPAASRCGSTARKYRSGVPRAASRDGARREGQEEDEHEEGHRDHREKGRTLWAGASGEADAHQTAVRTEGIADRSPGTAGQGQVDAGYRGLAEQFPDQVQARPLKPKKDAAPEETAAYEEQRHQQSSERICVEHANAEHKQWRVLQRFLGRRDDSARPTWPSPAWSPTAPPSGSHQPARQASTPQR